MAAAWHPVNWTLWFDSKSCARFSQKRRAIGRCGYVHREPLAQFVRRARLVRSLLHEDFGNRPDVACEQGPDRFKFRRARCDDWAMAGSFSAGKFSAGNVSGVAVLLTASAASEPLRVRRWPLSAVQQWSS